MAVNKTSLSTGAIIRAILLENDAVSSITKKIFPVATDCAELPYIVYRRIALSANPQKHGQPAADEAQVEVICFAGRYGESVELAEAVRAALDFIRAEHEGQVMRGCYLADGDETYQDDAYCQRLVFNVKI